MLALAAALLTLVSCSHSGRVGVAPPEWHPLNKIHLGMTGYQVQEILGEPDKEHVWPGGKYFIPMYFGADDMREEWHYVGVGRIIFRYGNFHCGFAHKASCLTVILIDYDPTETGQ
jgi:hypothetical protein